MRKNGRQDNELRPVSLEKGFLPHAAGSLLIKMGGTHVACAVAVEESVPRFLEESEQGWITAEYGMLPWATHTRAQREAARGRSGRTYEVQRLIGRSLRMMVDLDSLGPRTLRVDCDVLRADGGTRTAAITGAALVLRDVINSLYEEGKLAELPVIIPLAAISAGIVDGRTLLDLDYEEDSQAEVDANFVMCEDGRLVEVQCSAEGTLFSRAELDQLSDLAFHGIRQLLALWHRTD
ncbi:MAG: ribonuclease PH [Desulfobacterales bacterium SG8_35_2]|jgi:ribonuclease PH|nr:MAG: ribonuclease PH [Desulfobacterales bacterium SG8_35_2]